MYNIAITGVGGGVGQSIIKSLIPTDYSILALDANPLAAGLYLVDNSEIIPHSKSDNYISVLLDICKKHKISLLFPGSDPELMPLALNQKAFEAIGTRVVVSQPKVITLANDKQETYNQLKKVGVNIPLTIPASTFKPKERDFPFIVKPKVGGSGSINVFRVKNHIEWESLKNRYNLNDFICMDYIEGDEYTCGTINLDNQCKGIIVMRRHLRYGDTYKCFVEKSQTIIEEEVLKVVDAIKPFGACNVQLRLKNSVPYVFEINARCSGTTAARSLCGFNEPKLIADYLLKNIQPAYNIKEQTILRYWQEAVVDERNVKALKSKT